jgi:minor histocompatibility antigen H13
MNFEISPDQIIAYSSIFTMAVIPIWIGSHLSLNQKATEHMSSEDAWKYPFIGSGVLFGLYMLFKMFHKDYINLLLTAYFLLFGIFSVAATLKPIIQAIFSTPNENVWKRTITPLGKWIDPIDLEIGKSNIISLIIAIGIGYWYVMTKHWIANNIFGLCFSIQGVAMLSLGSYKVGCTLLGGLFVYDVFWVFGTDVMVTVAKSFDAPIKLVFPKVLTAEVYEFSMLGLGDIVIPGVFIALLLRFDKFKSGNKKNFSKSYFNACFFGYFLGLGTTIFVMHVFRAAQPALLYLVPACIGTSFGLAVLKGEVSKLLEYEEEQKKDDVKKEK